MIGVWWVQVLVIAAAVILFVIFWIGMSRSIKSYEKSKTDKKKFRYKL